VAEAPRPQDSRYMKVASFIPQEIFQVLMSIREMKNSNDNIGNRTRDPPACSEVPQSTALLHAPKHLVRKAYRCVFRLELRIILRWVLSKLNCVDVN